jgi:hypothetical protein
MHIHTLGIQWPWFVMHIARSPARSAAHLLGTRLTASLTLDSSLLHPWRINCGIPQYGIRKEKRECSFVVSDMCIFGARCTTLQHI